MSKKVKRPSYGPLVQNFLQDINLLSEQPTSKRYQKLELSEYPFDNELLNLSALYRVSRKLYISIGGKFSPRICSTMRALSAQDLFKDEIEYTPARSEILWFKDFHYEVFDPELEVEALIRFNEISLFHEQNHRILWRLLPPAPAEERDLCRYLNFAESLVVILDLALGDQLGRKLSPAFERIKVIYRSGDPKQFGGSKEDYRNYLLALLCTTYYALETMHYDDILKAVDYVLPGQKVANKRAVKRGLEINELFTRVTNPLWQERYWKKAFRSLERIHKNSKEAPLYLPEDPLDLGEEFFFARRVFDFYGL